MKSDSFQIQSRRVLAFAVLGMVGFGLTTPANAQSEILSVEFNQDDQEGFDLWPSVLSGAESIAEFATDAVVTSGTTTVTLTTNTGLSIPVNRGNISDGDPDGFTFTNLFQDLLHVASPTGFLALDFSGLNPNQNYTFTLYAWDPGATDSTDKEWTVTAGVGNPEVASVNFQDPLVDNDTFGLVFEITTTPTGTFQVTNTDGLPQSAINGFTLSSDGPPFGITEVSVDSPAGTSTLAWTSAAGQQYSVEGSADLLSWEEIANIPGESDRTTHTVTEDLPAPPTQYWRVRKVAAPPFFETSFEDGTDDWSVSGDGTQWEFGTPTAGPGSANSGESVAATGLAGDYADGTAVQLRTPVIDPGETTRVTLEFWYYLEAAQGDGGQISLLEADGTLIENLERLYLGGEDDTTEWTQENLRLPTLDPARPFIIQFAFLSVDDQNPSNGVGWLIDDVRIGK